MSKTKLSVLINLANSDGEVDASEKSLIFKIGGAHGMSQDEISDLIDNPMEKIDLNTLSAEDRFDTLYHLVHLMKVDGEIFDEEIMYCLNMARKLNYPLEAVMDLYGYVHANVKLTSEINKIKRKYE
ncbi:TerB family tellurite resistance protein [Marinoscillum sp.]|uniref:tellurite resistance TerB family protein n=1 Tax=Marinoscillum sp. TaxID=2024838 RepID=UPI003BA84338